MLVKREYNAARRVCRVINPVAKIKGAVIHRYFHIGNFTDFAIVIAHCFHAYIIAYSALNYNVSDTAPLAPAAPGTAV
jgi:hypothetical protein